MKTNKFYLMVAIIVATAGTIQAQTVDFGLKAGLNYATMPTSLKSVTDKEGKVGYNFGAFAGWVKVSISNLSSTM